MVTEVLPGANEAVQKILDNWFEENSWELTSKPSEDFEFLYKDSQVGFLISEVPTLQGQWFDDWARTPNNGSNPYAVPGQPGTGLGLKNYPGNFILSILHEVGHYNLDEEFTDASDYKGEKDLQKCIRWQKKYKDTLRGVDPQDCLIYFNCPEEREASQWAVDFLEDSKNQETLDKLKVALSDWIPMACL